jgi:Baseplate J-like protein
VSCACGADDGRVCRCDDPCPPPIFNPSGQTQIAYRAGDFASFRHALVRHAPGEVALAGWRPTADTDLALQVVDWWAYVADILAFYSERIANETYLGTASMPESVRRLIAVLGYRPRPGIGALAALPVLASGPGRLTLPAGFAIASKPVPGVDPQTFELQQAVTFAAPTSVSGPEPENPGTVPGAAGPPAEAPSGTAEAPAHDALIVRGGVLVKGKASGIAVGDRLLLIKRPWNAISDTVRVVTVTGLVLERDAHRRSNTRVLLSGTSGLSGAKAADFRLQRSTRTGHLATMPAGAEVVTATKLVLDGTARHLKAGDPLLVEAGGTFDVVRLSAYEEVVWYANANASTPTTSPGDSGIPLLVARLAIASSGFHSYVPKEVAVRSGWTDVGMLLDTPVRMLSGLPSKVTLARPPAATAGKALPAVIEDTRGRGIAATATPTSGGSQVALTPAANAETTDLQPPLRVLWDLITVSRGASVRDEQLGVGDATLPGQDFTLNRSPVTYLADAGSHSGDGYSSTVEVLVDDVRWTEVPRFFGRGPSERIFVTREDDEGKTHVLTGDGINGARLPTGARVIANYRFGSGATVPPVGTLTQVLKPAPNLAAVRNPVRAYGGADADPPEKLREFAPRSVLTFGRAISGTDYAAVAAQAPGVTRAAAEWAWDPGEQRALVRVHVGDDAGAVTAARTALREQADPNRPVVVLPAVGCPTILAVDLLLDPDRVVSERVEAARDALLNGLFTPQGLGLGEVVYRSRIEAAVDLPGVRAVFGVRMIWYRPDEDVYHDSTGPRFDPGSGGWFDLSGMCLLLTAETASDG